MSSHRKLLATAIARHAADKKMTLEQVKDSLVADHKTPVGDDTTCQLCTMAVTYLKVRTYEHEGDTCPGVLYLIVIHLYFLPVLATNCRTVASKIRNIGFS